MNNNLVLDDLEWAISSPLLHGARPPRYADWAARAPELLAHLRAHPEEVPDGLASQRRVPIGRYFERLVGLWLRQLPDIDRIHENLALQGDKGTMGELDLLIVAGGKAYHWELALKFYLGVGDRTSAASWHGPQGRDRLDRKLEKLTSHQLKLPSTPEGQELLAGLGIDSISSHTLIKGYLFHPFESWQAATAHVPANVNAAHLRGWWLPLAQSHVLQRLPATAWRILEKPDWLGATRGGLSIAPADLPEALGAALEGSRSTMLAALGPEGQELHRGFVVPDAWPRTMLQSMSPLRP